MLGTAENAAFIYNHHVSVQKDFTESGDLKQFPAPEGWTYKGAGATRATYAKDGVAYKVPVDMGYAFNSSHFAASAEHVKTQDARALSGLPCFVPDSFVWTIPVVRYGEASTYNVLVMEECPGERGIFYCTGHRYYGDESGICNCPLVCRGTIQTEIERAVGAVGIDDVHLFNVLVDQVWAGGRVVGESYYLVDCQ